MKNIQLLFMINKIGFSFFLFAIILFTSCKKAIIPPNITTATVTNIFANQAISGGIISSEGSSKVISRGVVWSTLQSPTIALSTKTIDGQGSGTFFSNITGLLSNTRYYIRAYATTATGTSYGNELSFTTNDINLINGLVAYYPFTGNGNDESDNKNNLTLNNLGFIKDRKDSTNRAVSTLNQIKSFARSTFLLNNIVNNFSYSIWVSPSANDIVITESIIGVSMPTQYVIHPAHGANWGDFTQNVGVGITVGTNQIAVIEHTHQKVSAPLVYPCSIKNWHHIAIVYENRIPKLYLDGILVKIGLKGTETNARPSNGFDTNVGYSNYNESGFGRSFNNVQFSGSFDDIRIYNRILTQAEITYLANN